MGELITAFTDAVDKIGFVQAVAVVVIVATIWYVMYIRNKMDKSDKEVADKQREYLERANSTMLQAIKSNNDMSIEVLTGVKELTAEVKAVVELVKYFAKDILEEDAS